MGMTQCPSCKRDVSTEAAACPNCGHQFRAAGGLNMSDPVHVIGLVVLAIVVIGVLLYIKQQSP